MTNPTDHSRASLYGRRRRLPWRRVWAVALVTLRQAMRMRLWILAPVAVCVLVVADLSSARFDPVFESIPAAVSTSLLVMTVVAVVLGIFFATYSIPAEMEEKVSYSVVTKPVSRWEIVAGKTVGMSLVVLVMLALVGAGAYVHIVVRAGGIRSLAAQRLGEARPRATHPADLNALEAAARDGPLMTYRYRTVDGGPDVQIRFPPDVTPEPGIVWILGETGMRLRWDLAETPLREWVASGQGLLRIALDVRPPPDAADKPCQVRVFVDHLGASAGKTAGADAKPGMPVSEAMTTLSPAGDIDVPVAAWDAPPVKNVLNIHPEGPIYIDVVAVPAGYLVGARPAAVRVLGPAGQEFRLKAAAGSGPATQGRKAYLVGRPELPRQVAVFRFDDVPGDVLGSGDTAVEIGFTLDAWGPATIQPAAEAVLVNPETGREERFRFTPEAHHSTLLYLDRDFWHGGPLQMRLECLTRDDYMGLVPESVRLRLGGGPFALHLAKAVFGVWLFGTVLAAAGVALSARLTWFVGILGTIAFFVLGVSREFVLRSTVLGQAAFYVARWTESVSGRGGWDRVAQHLLLPVPNLTAFLPGERVTMGEVVPLADLVSSLGAAALVLVLLTAVGAYLLRSREVAA